MDVPAVSRVPQEIWIEVATTLRDLPPLPHIDIVNPTDHRRCFHTNRHSRFCYATNTRLLHLFKLCRFLHDLLEPFLYDTVLIDGLNTRQTPSLIQTLTHRLDLLNHPRTIVISHSQKLNSADFDAFQLLLPRFRSLQHVYVYHSTISHGITQLLVNNPRLQSLSMEDCDWSADVPEDWSEGRFGGQLMELSLNNMPESPPTEDLNQLKYEQLFVPTLRVLELEAYLITKYPLSWTSSLAHLKTLTIGVTHGYAETVLSDLLPLLPSVEELRVDDFFKWGDFEFPANCLPRLRSLTGSLELGRHFAGRNEIEHLHIQSFYRNGTGGLFNVSPINDSIIPFPSLKMLVLPQFQCNEDALRALAHQYPLLASLAIISHDSLANKWIDDDIIPAFCGFPHLEILRLAWIHPADDLNFPSDEELAWERGLLEEIKRLHCPRLREARLSSRHRWRYLPDGGWIPVMRRFIFDVGQ